MRVLGVIFYATILILIGIAMIFFAMSFSFLKLQPQAIEYINNSLIYLQNSPSSRIVVFLCGLLLILISFSFAQLILGRFQREKNIAFKTASGEVTIALTAVEDLIRRISAIMPEIKELRPDVRASKKGAITVDLRVILKSEANIPDLTARLQEITRARIQEVLGVEEQIITRIHVTKIALPDERKRKDIDKQEPTIPFSGYGRV